VNANILAAVTDIDDEFYGTLFNVGSGKNHSVNEIASLISDDIVNIPSRIGESRVTLADNTKLRTILGWESKVEVETWIGENL